MINTDMSRRSFLKTSMVGAGAIGVSKSLFPSWMPRMAFRPEGATANRDVLVCIFLRGGIDGLCAVPPFGEGANYYDRRPTQSIAEPGSGPNSALDLDGFFGFHPSMGALKEIYDDNALSVIHATGMTRGSRSHFDAMLYMEYGTPGEKTSDTGWIARHLQTASWQNESPFRAIGLGDILPNSLSGSTVPLALKSIADFHLRGREGEVRKVQEALSRLYRVEAPSEPMENQAALVFDTMQMLEALNPEQYQPANGAEYGYDEEGFAIGLRQIAQLIKADVGLEVACIDFGGWDTHENQGTFDGAFDYLLSNLSDGLAAFYQDLSDHMGNITVVTMSEFGRTVDENSSAGTDHGHGNFMMLMGGGAKGGVTADWPTLAEDKLSGGDLDVTIDYRDILGDVLQNRIGNGELEEIFPNYRVNPIGLVTPRGGLDV